MTTVGITAVGSGIGQSVLRSLAHSGLDVRLVGMDTGALNSGMHWVDRAHLVPPVSDREAYLHRVREVCEFEGVQVLIPGLDLELPVLAAVRQSLGPLVLTSSERVIELSFDKLAAHDWFAERGLPFVRTLSLDDARGRAGGLDYPVIVKPRAGSGSVGAALVHGPERLLAVSGGEAMIVQTYLPPPGAAAPGPGAAVPQTDEISAQFLIGRDGGLLGEFVSVNRLKAGVPIEVVPVVDEPWVGDARPLAEALSEHGARGPLNLQGRLTSAGTVQFFELNARFTGITGVRAMLGFHEVEAALREFVHGDTEGARRALRVDTTLIGLRHVGDAVVPAGRVAAIVAGRDSGSAPAAASGRVGMTGASGYLGSVLREQLAGTPVQALPREQPSLEGIDTVLHLGGVRPVAGNSEAEMFRVNVEGTRQLVAAAREAGVRRLVLASSQSVYGTVRPPLWHENQRPAPETAYATSKWLAEQLCRRELAGDMTIVILRLGRLYGLGPGMRWEELPHLFARKVVAGEPLRVQGGQQRLDFLHVRDAARAVALAVTAALAPGSRTVLNVGGGHPVSLDELVTHYAQAGAERGLEIAVQREPAPDAPSFGMHIRHARALLGWHPEIGVGEAVGELVDAALSQSET